MNLDERIKKLCNISFVYHISMVFKALSNKLQLALARIQTLCITLTNSYFTHNIVSSNYFKQSTTNVKGLYGSFTLLSLSGVLFTKPLE